MDIFMQTNSVVLKDEPDEQRMQIVTSRIDRVQTGVIRTNCVDCLDRTNVVQQTICLKVMKELVHLKDVQNWPESFIYAWAMAGDLISRQYSGTASVLTKYTLKGYQNIYDKLE
jgi:phosphatidylinositol 4-phosphatase